MEASHTTRDVRKNMQDNKKDWEKQRNGHPAGYGRAETICAGSRDPPSSGLATTADACSEIFFAFVVSNI